MTSSQPLGHLILLVFGQGWGGGSWLLVKGVLNNLKSDACPRIWLSKHSYYRPVIFFMLLYCLVALSPLEKFPCPGQEGRQPSLFFSPSRSI